MYSTYRLARKYLHYYRNAMNGKGHGMHSPFVFRFILDVLNNGQGYTLPGTLQQLRKGMHRDHRLLTIQDLGAGSRTGNSRQRKVSQLAATAVKPEKYSRLFYRLVRRYQPQTILELGTSLGLTTAYMAAAAPGAHITTIEGSPEIRRVAMEHFQSLNLENITSLEGNFDVVLPQVLATTSQIDLAYVDGNHRYEPTIRYFLQLLEKAHNDTILVFDDIHWSAEMEQAWAEIKNHPSVRCTIDIFFLGFVLFRNEFREKQDFVIRY